MSIFDETPPSPTQQQTDDPSYPDICKRWADCDHWPLQDAIYLLANLPPKVLQTDPLTPEHQRRHNVAYELAKNDAGKSLVTITYGVPHDDVRVTPAAFLRWAVVRQYPVPPELKTAVDEITKQRLTNLSSKRKRQSSIHAEQYLKIAANLWKSGSTNTIEAMSTHPDIVAYSQKHNLNYTKRSIGRWIKAAASNHSPGRRPKNKTTL